MHRANGTFVTPAAARALSATPFAFVALPPGS
jgi:hypothetical protein